MLPYTQSEGFFDLDQAWGLSFCIEAFIRWL